MSEVLWMNPAWKAGSWTCQCAICKSIVKFDNVDDAEYADDHTPLYECPVCGYLNTISNETICFKIPQDTASHSE